MLLDVFGIFFLLMIDEWKGSGTEFNLFLSWKTVFEEIFASMLSFRKIFRCALDEKIKKFIWWFQIFLKKIPV